MKTETFGIKILTPAPLWSVGEDQGDDVATPAAWSTSSSSRLCVKCNFTDTDRAGREGCLAAELFNTGVSVDCTLLRSKPESETE